MADFRLPRRAPGSLPVSLPGQSLSGQSQAGIAGFLKNLPPETGGGTDTYRAGLDQSTGGDMQRGLASTQEAAVKAQQATALQAHKDYHDKLQATQQQVNTRNNDLKLAQNLLIATDPNTDPAVRKFMLSGLSNAAGVDPKGEYSQNLQKMVLGMKPDALEALRSSFGPDIRNAPPGAIQQGLNGLFSGKVPIENVIAQVKERQQAASAVGSAVSSPGTSPSAAAFFPSTQTLPYTGPTPIAGGAATTPAVALPIAPPSPTPSVDPSVAAAGEAAGTPSEPPITPPPVPEQPETAAAPRPIEPTADAETTPPPPVTTPETSAAPAAAAVPTPTTPEAQQVAEAKPDASGKVQVSDNLREAAKKAGDKKTLDMIAKIDERNAIIDSHTMSTQLDQAAQASTQPISGPAAELSGGPATSDATNPLSPSLSANTGKEQFGPPLGIGGKIEIQARELLDSAARQGARFPQTVKETIGLVAANKNPFAEGLDKAITEAKNVEEKAAGTQPVSGPAAEMSNPEKIPEPLATTQVQSKEILGQSPNEIYQDQITTLNAQRRQTPLPPDPALEYKKNDERPPSEVEVNNTAKGIMGLPPNVRYNVGDVQEVYTKYREDPEYQKKIETANDKRGQIYNGLSSATADISRIITMEGGAQAMGGFKIRGEDVTPGTVAVVKEKLASVFGVTKEHQDILSPVIQQKLNEFKTAHPELTPEQLAIQTARLDAALTRYAFEQAQAFNPRSQISNKDVEYAAKTTSNLLMTGEMAIPVLRDSLRSGLRAADQPMIDLLGPKGGNLQFDFKNNMSEQQRSNILQIHAATADKGLSPFDTNFIKDIAAAQRSSTAEKAGAAPDDSKALIPRGGNSPALYDQKLTEQKALGREKTEQELAASKQTMDLNKKKYDLELEKWAEDQRRHAATEARQAMLDARHAQEKIAAAFQHAGAMLAAHRGVPNFGGGGIGGGEQDTSAFRITAPPQRQAPRVGAGAPAQRALPQINVGGGGGTVGAFTLPRPGGR
jgi:hypothetical protein